MAWLEFFKLSNVAKISAIDFAAMIITYVWVVIFQQRNKKKKKEKIWTKISEDKEWDGRESAVNRALDDSTYPG